jgi:hypothetical protein
VENTFALVLPASNQEPTDLSQILALVRRSGSLPVRCEGTRVLVNVIKSLWSGDLVSSPVSSGINGRRAFENPGERQKKRTDAIRAVLTPECADALARLVGRSGRYPGLVNEGVVALSLLSTQKEGGEL